MAACYPLCLVLCCLPCYGHAKPLVILAELLADVGHEVFFVTSQPMAPRVRAMCKRDTRVIVLGVDDGLVPESDDFMLGRPANVKQHPVWFAEEKMTPPLTALIKGMSRVPDMVISDHLTWAGANAARSLGIEHACHVTWPLHMLEEAGVLPSRSLSSAIGANVRALRSSWLAPAFMKPPGPPQAMLDGVRRQCFGVGTQGGLVLVTSSFGLEPARSLPPLVKLIGRGHQPETADTLTGHPELKAFLDAHGVVVYVTFGSRVPPLPSVVRAVGEGLVAGGWAVAWSLKEVEASHLPRAALASGRFFVRPWLPQGAALAHPNIRAAVTHCGMGGLFECAVNAVPVVPLPFSLSADQPVNARAADLAGFAARPCPPCSALSKLKFWKKRGGDPEFTPGAIRDAVAKAVEDPALLEGAKRAKRAVLSAGYGHVAVDAVESCCLYGTDHIATGESDTGMGSRASQTLWALAAGVVAGVVVTAAAGFLATPAFAQEGSWGTCRIGGTCRTR